jgi:thioredoxin-related protein
MRHLNTSLILALSAAAMLTASSLRADPEYPKMGPDVFDVRSDGATQIAAAVATASIEKKRVILDFGANWCIWCRRLHSDFESNPDVSKALERGFIVVMIDVNTRNGVKRNAAVVEKYGKPIAKGIPALVVLDSDGKRLTTKDSGELEEGDGYSTAKIMAFLGSWALPGHP